MKLNKLIVAASLSAFALSAPACDKKEEAKKEDAADKTDDAKDDAKTEKKEEAKE